MSVRDYMIEMPEDSLERIQKLSEDNIQLIAQLNVFANRIATLEKENTELKEKSNEGKAPN